ncbi:MAG: 4Fe-4S dicluster-binding protein [Candidatus Bathyarchaeia archaeon]|jgi:pyruvate ferredoxin oxidoreductase delta subunit
MNQKKPLSERMKLSWREMPFAGIMFEPGSSVEYKTGDWRIEKKPQIDGEKCIRCYICWIFCPDVSIKRVPKPYKKHTESVEVDYYHCKGCGICAAECPVDAIEMIEESKDVP